MVRQRPFSNQRVREILENIKEQELKIIFFAKLSPVLPFALTNFVFALSGAKLKNILLGGFLGMIPRTVLAVWTGHQAKEIRKLLENPNEGSLQQILLIVLLCRVEFASRQDGCHDWFFVFLLFVLF